VIVLDTNVISEPMKPQPAPKPVAWLDGIDIGTLYLSSITLAELQSGLQTMPTGKRQDVLRDVVSNLEVVFKGRMLLFDVASAIEFGSVIKRARAVGNNMTFADAAIAAIAMANGFSVATRDVNDFRGTGIKLINPWD
jgi:toxin FitB